MATDLLAPDQDTTNQPVDLLAPETTDGAKVSEPSVPTATTYVPEKNLSIDHPADMSHDQLNDTIQTQVLDRPRNLSFKFDPAELGVEQGLKEPGLVPETAKAAVRMVESVPKGISALIGIAGEAGVQGAKERFGPGFDAKVSQGFADMGDTAYEFFKQRETTGWEAPDPEVFRGSFMSNPSVTRLVADIIQNVPIVAATSVASATTGGAAPLALFGAMAAGEAGKAAEEHGATPQQAEGVGALAGVGNMILMSLPMGKWVQKLGLQEPVSSSVSFATLGAAMTPFNNIVAKIGGERSRKLFDGFAESLLSMAASGFFLGSFIKGGAAEHDADVSAAAKSGVTPGEIDAARKEIAKQIVANAETVNASLLEKIKNIKFEAPSQKNEDETDATSFNFGANDKENEKLSEEEKLLRRDIEEAQGTIASYESKQEFVQEVGKFRKPADGQLKEELSTVSKRFFTTDKNAETLDEVADRMGITSNELIDRLQAASKTSVRADKAGYKDAKKLLAETDAQAVADANERLRVAKEAGREYVKNEPFSLTLGPNDKTTAKNIRGEAAGMRDVQRARGFHLAEELQRLLPNEADQRGLFWYRAAEGDQAWLKEAADAEEMAPYKDAIEKALNPSPDFLEAAAKLDKFYKEWGEVGRETGVLPEDLRRAYQAGWYKPEKPTNFIKSEGGAGFKKLSSEHGQQKIYDNPFQAVQSGKELATDNAVEAMKKYNLDMATTTTNRKLADAMTERGLAAWTRKSKMPADWEQVGTISRDIPVQDENGEVILGKDGNQLYSSTVLAAPKGLAKGLEASTDPNYLAKVDAARGLAKYQQFVKMADVSLGFFHDFNEMKASLYSRGFQDISQLGKLQELLASPNFKEQELHLIEHTGTTIASHPNTDVMASLREYMASLEPSEGGLVEKAGEVAQKVKETPGVKQVAAAGEKVADKTAELIDNHSNFLFNEAMRYYKVKDYWGKVSDWVAKHPNATNEEARAAGIGFAEHVNAKYGGLNWEALGFSKTHVALLRLGEFAPDWTQAKFEMVKQAVGGGTAGSSSRAYLGVSMAVGMLATEATNALLTGHFTNENEKGHFMEVEISPGVHVSLLPGVLEDLANLTARVVTGGPIEGGLAWAQGKGSPVLRLAAMAMSRTLYSGAPVVQRSHRGDPWSMTYDWLKAIMQEGAPVPFAASSLSRYLSSDVEKSVQGALATGTGVGKFSEQHKTKGQSFA